MNNSAADCFVEKFHLRSPVEEFEEYSRNALEQLRAGDCDCDESNHREAISLVLRKLRQRVSSGAAAEGAGR